VKSIDKILDKIFWSWFEGLRAPPLKNKKPIKLPKLKGFPGKVRKIN